MKKKLFTFIIVTFTIFKNVNLDFTNNQRKKTIIYQGWNDLNQLINQ